MGKPIKKVLPQTEFRLLVGEGKNKALKLLPDRKHLPEWIWQLSDRQVALLLDELVKGDGSTWKQGKSRCLYGEEQLLDEIQALLVTHNLRAHKCKNRQSFYLSISNNPRSIVQRSARKVINYRGKVYGISVENETLFARRNGKVLITGNSLEAPMTSNWDLMLYNALKTEHLAGGIEIYPCKEFAQIVPIQGFKFFCFHGDQIRSYQGVPYFALVRKIISWFITYGGFAYSCSGHWHKDDILRVSAKTKHFMNGALPTDDPYALKVIGTSAIPTQWTFGVHAKKGVTWCYSLVLDEAFLPMRN